MTCNRSKNILKIYREIQENGYAGRQSYTYKLNEAGEIIKENWGKITVYATKEEVDDIRLWIEQMRISREQHEEWMKQKGF